MHNKFYILIFLTVLALAGCMSHSSKKQSGEQASAPTYMLYSPNGEPLNGGALGKPTCQKAITDWFSRLSTAHDGVIPQAVFLNDAQIQFATMDIDHNGYIVSEELDRFRESYRQQAGGQKQGNQSDVGSQQKHSHKGTSAKGVGGNDHNATQGGASPLDPVMSADTNLDFKVTPEEFTKQAQDTFAKLDVNHDGMLEQAEVITLCPKEEK